MNECARAFALALLVIALPIDLPSQIVVDTFAGGLVRSGVPAQDVSLYGVAGLAWDSKGSLVFCEGNRNVIRRITADGVLETIGGTGTSGFAGDGGLAVNAMLNSPANPRFDAQGNLYFADIGNLRIRRIDQHAVITTVAGDGVPFASGMDLEGPALQLSLNTITDLLADTSGDVYFTESHSDFVRRVTGDGRIEIFAGVAHPDCPTCSDGDGGPAPRARLYAPSLLASDGAGDLYVGDTPSPGTFNGIHGVAEHIRRITPDGIISQFAGYGQLTANNDGQPALNVAFALAAMAADQAGNIYVTQIPGANSPY